MGESCSVACGTMLQAERSWVRFPVRSLNFSVDLILSAAQWPLGSTNSLTFMSTSNFRADKARPELKAHLNAIREPIV
jgi:hypothetical protein